MTDERPREWLIWSHYHCAWHRRSKDGGACGYTQDIAGAGLFDEAKAKAYDGGEEGRDKAIHASERSPQIKEALLNALDTVAALSALARAADL